MLALFLKVSAFSFSVWKLSEGVIVPCSVFALSMLLLDGLVATMLFKHGSVGASVFWILFIGA